jgi:triosephosphate isomerase
MMRMRKLIAGNWKMHGVSAQLAQIEAVANNVATQHTPADVLICVPATLIARADAVAAGRIAIGGEDCSAAIEGSMTGDMSAEMLKDAGASAVILGHSERRHLHGETNADVAAKAKAAWRGGLMAIICIGETAAQRAAGHTHAVCDEQIAGSVPPAMNGATTAIAHEPLWAIGTGHTPTAQEIADVQGHIRACLVAHFGAEGNAVRILYGGSVKPDNAAAILRLPDVDGALVGGASLQAGLFTAIIAAAR